MQLYSQALYAMNSPTNLETENVASNISFAKEVTAGSYVIVPYLFSSSSSVDTLVRRKLVAVVTNVKKDDIEIEYASAVSTKRIKFIGNDKGSISKDSTLTILPQPNYKRGVYEFLDELEIEIL